MRIAVMGQVQRPPIATFISVEEYWSLNEVAVAAPVVGVYISSLTIDCQLKDVKRDLTPYQIVP